MTTFKRLLLPLSVYRGYIPSNPEIALWAGHTLGADAARSNPDAVIRTLARTQDPRADILRHFMSRNKSGAQQVLPQDLRPYVSRLFAHQVKVHSLKQEAEAFLKPECIVGPADVVSLGRIWDRIYEGRFRDMRKDLVAGPGVDASRVINRFLDDLSFQHRGSLKPESRNEELTDVFKVLMDLSRQGPQSLRMADTLIEKIPNRYKGLPQKLPIPKREAGEILEMLFQRAEIAALSGRGHPKFMAATNLAYFFSSKVGLKFDAERKTRLARKGYAAARRIASQLCDRLREEDVIPAVEAILAEVSHYAKTADIPYDLTKEKRRACRPGYQRRMEEALAAAAALIGSTKKHVASTIERHLQEARDAADIGGLKLPEKSCEAIRHWHRRAASPPSKTTASSSSRGQ